MCGSPQGCVLSLYSMYTDDCFSHCESVNILHEFADDTTLIGLITGNNELDYIESTLIEWSCIHNLKLNVLKTKEMVFDFQQGY